MLDEIDYLHAPAIKQRVEAFSKAKDENDKKVYLAQLTKAIIEQLSNVTIAKIDDSVTVDNLDVLQASLRNELTKVSRDLSKLLTSIKLSTDDQTRVIQEVNQKTLDNFNKEFQPIVIKRPGGRVEVSNLSDIIFPPEIKVNNLEAIKEYFDSLEKVVKDTFSIDVPTPEVTVNLPEVQAPVVNVPETKINIPELDLSPLIDVLESNLKILKTNNVSHPLAVRLSDGGAWIKKLEMIADKQREAFAAFPGSIRIQNSDGNMVDFNTIGGSSSATIEAPTSIGDGSKDVASAGTREALGASTTIKYVVITAKDANTGVIWVGGATVAAGRGRPLVALQSEKIDIDNLSKVYIDSTVSAEGVNFVYVA